MQVQQGFTTRLLGATWDSIPDRQWSGRILRCRGFDLLIIAAYRQPGAEWSQARARLEEELVSVEETSV